MRRGGHLKISSAIWDEWGDKKTEDAEHWLAPYLPPPLGHLYLCIWLSSPCGEDIKQCFFLQVPIKTSIYWPYKLKYYKDSNMSASIVRNRPLKKRIVTWMNALMSELVFKGCRLLYILLVLWDFYRESSKCYLL